MSSNLSLCPEFSTTEVTGARPSTTTSDTSDSDQESEPAKSFHRRISTNRTIKNTPSIKEGYLVKHSASSFHRSRRRYFKLKGRILYYCKDSKSEIYNEIDLIGSTIAECSSKIMNLSFQVITTTRNFVITASCRQDMDAWMNALKTSAARDYYEPDLDHLEMMSGAHNWNACSHARPTYCNVCRDILSGVMSHGLSCDVCKLKCHKRCAIKAQDNCKWTTLSSVGEHIIEDEGMLFMAHQWLEGNLSVSAKCSHCSKACGSVIRLQDYRCLWCKATVHSACREYFKHRCDTGPNRVSVLPPTRITNLDSDGRWRAHASHGSSPLLVFVNSKSGDNRGIKMLRKFKQLLNPAQVFDLMNGGPTTGLRLFQNFESFRVIVAGGDGSIGWVLNEIDKLSLQSKSQVGVLPLGTGNDLARVLGWGAIFDDDAQLPSVLERMEHAQIKMLDRWSIMTYEGHMPSKMRTSKPPASRHTQEAISKYEDSIASHLSNILNSSNHATVISSAKVLCETVKGFVARISVSDSEECDTSTPPRQRQQQQQQQQQQPEQQQPTDCQGKCEILTDKLDALLKALHNESTPVREDDNQSGVNKDHQNEETNIEVDIHKTKKEYPFNAKGESCIESLPIKQRRFLRSNDHLISRANSLKKAFQQLIIHAETVLDDQNQDTAFYEGLKDDKKEDKTAIPCINIVSAPSPSQTSPDIQPDLQGDDIVLEESEAVNTMQNCPMMSSLRVPNYGSAYWVSDSDTSSVSSASQLSPNSPVFWSVEESEDSPPMASPHSEPQRFLFPPVSPEPRRNVLHGTPSRRISSASILHGSVINLSTPSLLLTSSSCRSSPDEHCHITSTSTSASASYRLDGNCCAAAAAAAESTFPILASDIHHTRSSPKCGYSQTSLGGGFVSKALMVNADTLCAAVSPLIPEEVDIFDYGEHCVMNNYFGIGLDAKITLDFHVRREEHPEKCRSRTRNMMLYGVIGGRAIVRRRWRNLDQRVRLECDGRPIPLPNLQGLVVLNIPSYMGGINFWGNSKTDDNFAPVSFDDKILEVVAVFGGVQLGMSRVINLQHHRIAQCRSVKITITGDEGVPIQVDGEAWIQPPGYIKICHKNRSQMLIRDKVFEEALKVWREKQRVERLYSKDIREMVSVSEPCPSSTSDHRADSDLLTYSEMEILSSFVDNTQRFINSIKVASAYNACFDQELKHLVQQCSCFLSRITQSTSDNNSSKTKSAVRKQVSDLVSSVRSLYHETSSCMADKSHTEGFRDDVLQAILKLLKVMSREMRNVYEIGGLPHLQDIEQEAKELRSKKRKQKSHFRLVRLKRGGASGTKKDKDNRPNIATVYEWGTHEVGLWLDSLKLGEDYKAGFASHDIRGSELLSLGRQDLKELGVSKVGHLKRIQHSIKELIHDYNKL